MGEVIGDSSLSKGLHGLSIDGEIALQTRIIGIAGKYPSVNHLRIKRYALMNVLLQSV